MPSSTAKPTTNATTVFNEPPVFAAAVATATGETVPSGVVVDSMVGVHCCATVPGGLAVGVPPAGRVVAADEDAGARETVDFPLGDGLAVAREGDGLALGRAARLALGLGDAEGVAAADPDAEPDGDGLPGEAGTMEGTGPATGRAALSALTALVRPPRASTEPTTRLTTVAAKKRGTCTTSW